MRSIAVLMNGVPSGAVDGGDLLVVFNADDAAIDMTLPPPPEGSTWRLVFDTSDDARAAPAEFGQGRVLRVEHRSTVLLESQVA